MPQNMTKSVGRELNMTTMVSPGKTPCRTNLLSLWTILAVPAFAVASPVWNGAGIAFGNNTFVAVGNAGTMLSSTDGLSWTGRNLDKPTALKAVTFAGGMFVGVGASGDIESSVDGLKWAWRKSGTPTALRAIPFDNAIFLPLGVPAVICTLP